MSQNNPLTVEQLAAQTTRQVYNSLIPHGDAVAVIRAALDQAYAAGVAAKQSQIVTLIEAEIKSSKEYIAWYETQRSDKGLYERDADMSAGTIRSMEDLLEAINK